MTDRLNSFKTQYYRIDIIIGKILLKKWAGMFHAEDQLAVDLKHMCKSYDRRVSLALIPFYMERLEYLKGEIDTQEASEKNTTKDLTFLRNMQTNIQRDLDFERNELRESA